MMVTPIHGADGAGCGPPQILGFVGILWMMRHVMQMAIASRRQTRPPVETRLLAKGGIVRQDLLLWGKELIEGETAWRRVRRIRSFRLRCV